jgi:hypothetical protein
MALAASLAFVPVDSLQAEDPLRTGTLSGRFVGPEGQPVAGARVWTDFYDTKSSSRKLLVEAHSDAGGRFSLGPTEPVYRLRFGLNVRAEGFAGQCIPSGNLAIFPGRDTDMGTIQLDRGRVFTGTVIDIDGKPLAGARVGGESFWHSPAHTIGGAVTNDPVMTDENGRFRTSPLPVGHLILPVKVPDRRFAYFASRPIAPGGEEDIGTIRLEKDVPVHGVVKDEEGRPIPEVKVVAFGISYTDAHGRFTFRGYGPNPSFQMNVIKDGYAALVGRVTVTEAGVRWGFDDESRAAPLAPDLVVTLSRAGWIEGQAVDADTGEPVRLDRVVVCNFERKPTGEVILRGCRSDFEQTEPGRFRASYPAPNEYHLTFSANGYHDAEAYTPKVSELKTIEGIVARMKKKAEGSTPVIARQTITGSVTRDRRPVKTGWAGLWAMRRTNNAINSAVMRERTAVGEPMVYASAPIHEGLYSLDVPFQSDAWFVVAEEPGYALTQAGPLAIALNQQKTFDISCVDGGRIRGRVTGVPLGWEGHVWVVAFSKTAVRAEVRVDRQGTFTFALLPPGEYGLKVGHDAYDDPEVYPGALTFTPDKLEAYKAMSDPWKRAKVVRVEAGRDTDGLEVEMPR